MTASDRRAVLAGLTALAALAGAPRRAWTQDALDRVGRSTVPVRLNGRDLIFALDTASQSSTASW